MQNNFQQHTKETEWTKEKTRKTRRKELEQREGRGTTSYSNEGKERAVEKPPSTTKRTSRICTEIRLILHTVNESSICMQNSAFCSNLGGKFMYYTKASVWFDARCSRYVCVFDCNRALRGKPSNKHIFGYI